MSSTGGIWNKICRFCFWFTSTRSQLVIKTFTKTSQSSSEFTDKNLHQPYNTLHQKNTWLIEFDIQSIPIIHQIHIWSLLLYFIHQIIPQIDPSLSSNISIMPRSTKAQTASNINCQKRSSLSKQDTITKPLCDELQMTCALWGYSAMPQGQGKAIKQQNQTMSDFFHGIEGKHPNQIKMLAKGTSAYKDLYECICQPIIIQKKFRQQWINSNSSSFENYP